MVLLWWCCVFLILVSTVYSVPDGYIYPQPQPPIQFDEISTPLPPEYLPPPQSPPFQDEIPQTIPTYLPPNIYPPIGSPPLNDDIQPPYDDTVIVPSPPSNQYLPPKAVGRQAQSRIVTMSCLDPRDGAGYFRATFRSGINSRVFPVIESAPSNDCLITPSGADLFRIDLDGARMSRCGVRNCGNRLCLTVRMAGVNGLRLADDPLVTLQCIPQETIVSNVKHIRLNTAQDQGRSSSRAISLTSGGNQRRFDPQISLFRRISNSDTFEQPIQQGGTVRLGDELMLKATVLDTDGWQYSRMGAVTVRSAASQRSVLLVDEDGCRSPAMKSICPTNPQQLSPLTIQLPFRAFLFQGAEPADDMLVSVRMLGCLRSRDCVQGKSCIDGRQRIRRESNNTMITNNNNNNNNDTMTGWESEFQFRVLPNDEFDQVPIFNVNFLILGCFIGIIGILICIIFCLLSRGSNKF